MEEQVEKLLSEKGFVKYGYQFDFLINPEFLKPKFPIVYALGTGGGKTYTTIMKIDLFYSDLKNKGKKTVIFPHATNVLKDNFIDAIKNYGEKSFTYKVINYTSEIKETFVSNVDVIIMLPQLVINHLSKLKKVEWLIVDEAHEWYGQKSYKKILKVLNPTYQLLLTGTPAKFNRNRSEFLFHYTSVDTLRKLGKLGNARVEIVSSNYNLKREDITTSLNVRKRVVSKNNKSSLEDVCKQMLISLKNPTTLRSKTPNNLFGTVFNSMKKTLIVCNSQKQAKEFYKILNSKIPNKVLVSISDDGGDSSEFKIFKQNLDILVLLIVRKGRLGFDMPHLHNIVDFSLTTNIDVISQMLGRVLRKDDNNSLKYYFKVAPQNTVWFYQAIMMVVLRVTMQDAFETYDGNQNKISIPNPKPPKERQSRGQKSESRDPSFKEIATDLIMDMDFFNYINHKGNRSFQTVSYTTLDEVRKECLGIRDRNTELPTYEECLESAKRWEKKGDWQKFELRYYSRAFDMGWLNDIVKKANLTHKHFITKEDWDNFLLKNNFTKKNTKKEVTILAKKQLGVGIITKVREKGWHWDFLDHKTGSKSKDFSPKDVKQWIIENNLKGKPIKEANDITSTQNKSNIKINGQKILRLYRKFLKEDKIEKLLADNRSNPSRVVTKKILQFDLEGNFIKAWDSLDLTKNSGYTRTPISSVLNGRQKTAHGFIWKYEEDNNNFKLKNK